MIEITVWCDNAICDMNVCHYPAADATLTPDLTRRYMAELDWTCDERGYFCPHHDPEEAS